MAPLLQAAVSWLGAVPILYLTPVRPPAHRRHVAVQENLKGHVLAARVEVGR